MQLKNGEIISLRKICFQKGKQGCLIFGHFDGCNYERKTILDKTYELQKCISTIILVRRYTCMRNKTILSNLVISYGNGKFVYI